MRKQAPRLRVPDTHTTKSGKLFPSYRTIPAGADRPVAKQGGARETARALKRSLNNG